jgi:hypothetical protein
MMGCWRRAWIELSDGTRDETTSVVWLQTDSSMVDVRVDSARRGLSDRGSFRECSDDDLHAIAASDASSGFTDCGSVVVGTDGLRRATATWHTRGHGVNFQPVSAFPEPGEMTWNADGTVMIERAPSGAYCEEWRLVPGSRDLLAVSLLRDGLVYRAGDIAVLVRDRRAPIPRQARLPELLREYREDRPMMEALLDCEFSVAERSGNQWLVTISTLPWKEGKAFDVDLQ